MLLSCDTFFQIPDTADKMKHNVQNKNEPETETKYRSKNELKWERKNRLDTHHKYKRNQILGIVQSQRTQKHGNV